MPTRAASVLSTVAILTMFILLWLPTINSVTAGSAARPTAGPVGAGGPTPTVTLISGVPVLSLTLSSTSSISTGSASTSSMSSSTSTASATFRSTTNSISTSQTGTTTSSTATSSTSETSSTSTQTQSTTTVSASCSTANSSNDCFIATVTYYVPNPATCAENPNVAQCKWDGVINWEGTNGASGYTNTLNLGGNQGSYSFAIYYYVGFLNEGYPISWTVRMYTPVSNSTMTFTLADQSGVTLVQQSTAQTGYYMLFGNYYPT